MAEIQLPLKRFPDSIVSCSNRKAWAQLRDSYFLCRVCVRNIRVNSITFHFTDETVTGSLQAVATVYVCMKEIHQGAKGPQILRLRTLKML